MSLTSHGQPSARVLEALEASRVHDLRVTDGHAMAYAYNSGDPDLVELGSTAFSRLLANNALYPDAFPSTPVLENEVVGATADLLNAGVDARGIFTTGGTESIMLAVRAARDSRPDVSTPSIVLPETAHAAFYKAAQYLGLDAVSVPVAPDTFTADPVAMAAAMDERTVLVVASAFSYGHGVLDPVADIAATAASRGVLCHVDACVGAFILPFFRELGDDIPPFDFSVPGVTSMSADLHKYGYTPKGASVVLFRDAELRRHAHFACSRWSGYTIINTTVQSSRSAGATGAAWAVLRYLGHEGYLDIARRTRTASRQVIDHLRSTPRLKVLGDPIGNMAAFVSTDPELDIFVLADELKSRGWFTQPQFRYASSPANLHISLHGATLDSLTDFRRCLAEAMEAALQAGPATPDAETLALVAGLDPSTLTPDAYTALLAGADLGGDGRLPQRMATVNHLLNAATPALREQLLLAFLDGLYVPTRSAGGEPYVPDVHHL
ncbi:MULTISPECIES: pyridoxal phosphate-dependent decarboxylase family protein [unclassified Streptomyces]|uniref:pyridoxal phosphate-dependent decarboxylase family protein n=1 Tax=unclassified Streptomyces TaxID=2593676 RepID=UPI0035D6F0C5